MSLIKDLRTFILEDEFKITYSNNKLGILNYSNISHFDSSKIMNNYKNGIVLITGQNLIVSKLLIDELLIEGGIEKIELR